MRACRSFTCRLLGGFLLVSLALSALAAWAQDKPAPADRTAEIILQELDSLEMPQLDPSQSEDRQYVLDYLKKRQEVTAQRGTLIQELAKVAPGNERLPELLVERWSSASPLGEEGDTLLEEINSVLAKTDNQTLKVEGAFARVRIQILRNMQNPSEAMPAIEEFLKVAPEDSRGAQLLYMVIRRESDPEKQKALEDRLVEAYPDSPAVAMIAAERKRREAIGKPFELEFTDAISGSTVSMKDLKGKVVVIDFWATWCGPCVAEMPNMKELYAQYKDKGVEFIGVSLDQPKEDGGLDALKEYVSEEKIEWPQYYQGDGWDSEFSSSWGINSIPAMFAVDADGKLYSVEARGKLDTLLPELIEKRDATKPDAGE